MTIYTIKAFEEVFNKTFDDTLTFLNFFKEKRCYLEDLTSIPVNKMSTCDRENTLEQGITQLSVKLVDYNPEAILIVLKKIDRYVKKAIKMAGLSCPVYTLPFPGNGHQNKFIKELSSIINNHYIDS